MAIYNPSLSTSHFETPLDKDSLPASPIDLELDAVQADDDVYFAKLAAVAGVRAKSLGAGPVVNFIEYAPVSSSLDGPTAA